MRHSNEEIIKIIRRNFDYLIIDFGMVIGKTAVDDDGIRLRYVGEKTAVSLIFEFRSAYINIILHRLIDGKIVNDKYPYCKDFALNNIGLDFIVKYKNPQKLTKPLYDDSSTYFGKDNAFEIFVKMLSNNLKEFAADILNGNFSLFHEVDSFVKDYHK